MVAAMQIAEKKACTSIVACSYATPVLHTAEGILDPMTLPIEDLVVGHLSVFGRRNAGLDPTVAQPFPEPIAVISAIAEQRARRREHREQESGPLVVVHLSFGEHHDDRSAVPVDAFNAILEAARETVGDACKDYAGAVAKLERFARQMAEEQTADFVEHSERWRESEAGQRAVEWIGFYMSFKAQVPEIELQTAVDVDLLSDDLLSAFEEVPDLP
jgi:hypothetical protein